jgi:uncharacterized membrane protein
MACAIGFALSCRRASTKRVQNAGDQASFGLAVFRSGSNETSGLYDFNHSLLVLLHFAPLLHSSRPKRRRWKRDTAPNELFGGKASKCAPEPLDGGGSEAGSCGSLIPVPARAAAQAKAILLHAQWNNPKGATSMPFCAHCGSQIAENAAFCAACGNSTSAATPPPAAPMTAPPYANSAGSAGLADNIAGMLAYVTIVPAIVFLAVEPYNKKPFVRFHSYQSIFLFVLWAVVWMVTNFFLAPIMGILAHLLLSLVGLGFFVLWIILLLKANQGQMFKVPVIGDLAEKQASSI